MVRSMFDMRKEAKREPRGGSAPPLRLNSISRHPDVDEDRLDRLLGQKRSEDGLQHLIEFLQNTPPAENYMSIADSYSTSSSEDNHNKWRRLKVFRKKRKGKGRRRPPVIKLPDSAVAAMTTGGHRHIAISIPFEHSHLGPISPSQYPVFDSLEADFTREVETRLGPMRMLGPERGVVTVLRPVAEDHESFSSDGTSPSPRGSEQPRPMYPPRIPVRRHSLGSPYWERKSSLRGMARSYSVQDHRSEATAGPQPSTVGREMETPTSHVADVSSRIESPTKPRDGHSGPRVINKSHSRSTSAMSNTSTAVSSITPSKLVLPPRGSSNRAKARSDNGESIANILHNVSPRNSVNSRPRSLVAESISTQASDLRIFHRVPIVVRHASWQARDPPAKDDPPQTPTHRVDRSSQTDLTSTNSIKDRVRNRREQVRQKKQRDLHKAQINSKHSHGHPQHFSYGRKGAQSPESPILGTFSDISAMSSPRRRPDLTPINVAIDVLTGSPSSMSEMSPGQMLNSSKRFSSEPSTPPSTPSSAVIPLDQTPSRGLRERVARSKAKYAANMEADHNTESTEGISKQHLLERYETLKQDQFRDMEKRVRRLERNGEKWLRSMVPLMETLNKLLQEQYAFRREAGYGYAYPHNMPAQWSNAPSRHQAKDKTQTRSSSLERPATLRSCRSFDSLLDQKMSLSPAKQRPVTFNIPGRTYGTAFLGTATTAHRPPQPGRSLLQEEFEKALEMRRASERRANEVDDMMRRTQQQLRMAQGSVEGAKDEPETAATEKSLDDGESSDLGIDLLEPVMRELQGTARLRGGAKEAGPVRLRGDDVCDDDDEEEDGMSERGRRGRREYCEVF